MNIHRIRRRGSLLAGLMVLLVFTGCREKKALFPSYERWDPEIVEQFRSWPLLDGGRVKPFESVARVSLLRFSGRRSIKFDVGTGDEGIETVKLSANEWLLDVLFRPELANQMPVFNVDDAETVVEVNVEPHAKRRSKYNFDELIAQRESLGEKGAEYGAIKEEDRSRIEQSVVRLASNVADYGAIELFFRFAREGMDIDWSRISDTIDNPEPGKVRVTDFFRNFATIQAMVERKEDETDEAYEQRMAEMGAPLAMGMETLIRAYIPGTRKFASVPPRSKDDERWHSPGAIMETVHAEARSGNLDSMEWEMETLRTYEDLARSEPSSAAFKEKFLALRNDLQRQIEARGEGETIPVENALYKGRYFSNSLVFFIMAFVALALGWLAPGSGFGKWSYRGSLILGWIGLALLVIPIVMRCIVMGRAPVATLYETIIFICACVVLVSLVIEIWVPRQVAAGSAFILGIVGLFLAGGFDAMKAEDTMRPIQAVLMTNFWLGTHVIAVTLGYAGALLAGFVAHVYIFGKIGQIGTREKDAYRFIARMVYGITCFALLFSLVGTILGGIWGNQSWGRFWGWDPKENGAIMIVLWCLVMLHMRLGGYIRDLGICIMAVLGNIVVAFSWWYVNVMGVGLHSYGFTAGIKKNVMLFWLIQLLVAGVGVVVWYMQRASKSRDKADQPRQKKVPVG